MKKIIKNNYLILIPIIFLNIISILYLHNTSYYHKHIIYLSIGYILLLLFSKINIKPLFNNSKYLYIISIILLALVLIFGREINGSKAWLHLFGFSIQPSEITKLTLSIYLINLTINNKNILLFIFISLIPCILTFLEPDTGAIIFYLIIFISILKYSNLNKKSIIIISTILFLFILTNIITYITNKELLIKIYGPKIFYRLDRLISFKEQNNIQNINSLIAIGSHNLIYIPENHNDFIFASIISLYNPFIFFLIILSYSIIFIIFINNLSQKKNISNIYNFILLNMLLFQIFYNILMNLSLVPIIGIPLPFLSYGGSYIIILYIMIGLSINLNRNLNKKA